MFNKIKTLETQTKSLVSKTAWFFMTHSMIAVYRKRNCATVNMFQEQ